MKLLIKQNILLEHLNYVIKGVSNKNLIPILNCIKLDLTKEGLFLESTDNEIAIKSFIKSEDIETIDELGILVVSGKYLYEIIRKMPSEIIKIEDIDSNKIVISTKNSEFNLNCNEMSDFPNLELEVDDKPILLNKQIFKEMVNQIAFATSNQESRPTLVGINFIVNKDTLECTGTDSYRLSKKIIKIKEIKDAFNIIIPTRNLLELIKIIDEKDEEIEIYIFTNKVIFKFDNIIFLTRLINGSFPDTSKLISDDFLNVIEVKYRDIYNAIGRASLLSVSDEKNTILFEINKNIITISSRIPEIGTVEEKIEIISKTGDDFRISFSSVFMIDALRALNSENIILKFNGELKPFIIREKDNDLLTELIVPIRTY